MSVGWVAAGAGVVSSVIGSKASKKAASAQAQAAADAQALQQQQYEQTREDNAPFRERGNQAGNRLQFLLGLDGSKGAPGMSSAGGLTGKELVTMNGGVPGMNQDLYTHNADYRAAWDAEDAKHRGHFGTSYTRDSNPDALTQDLRSRLADVFAREQAASQVTQQAAEQSPDFGSLLRKFTMADRDADPIYSQLRPQIDQALQRSSNFETSPGYAFRKAEGAQAVENSAAARGMQLSGAGLKALQRFGQDFASNEYDRWFGQANTDRNFVAAQGDGAYNRFNNNNTNTFNRLSAVAGTGQQATRDVNTAGANYASAAGNAIMGGGEARAAGYLGQANAFNTGASQAIGGYQNNELMKLIRGGGNRSSFVAGGSPSGGFGTGYGYGEQDYGQYF